MNAQRKRRCLLIKKYMYKQEVEKSKLPSIFENGN